MWLVNRHLYVLRHIDPPQPSKAYYDSSTNAGELYEDSRSQELAVRNQHQHPRLHPHFPSPALATPTIIMASALFFLDLKGKVLKHHSLAGEVESWLI